MVRTKKRTWSTMVNSGLKTAAKAVFASAVKGAGRYVQNKRSKLTNKFLEVAKKSVQSKYGKKKRSAKWNNVSTGVYSGKFKKPTAVKNSIFTKCLQNGYEKIQETFGRIEDPDVCYLGHSTKNHPEFSRVIIGAILRKLFLKAGISLGDGREEINFTTFDLSEGFRLEFVTQNPITKVRTLFSTLTSSDNLTFNNLVDGWIAVIDHFNSYLRNVTQDEPYSMSLFAFDKNVAELFNYRLMSRINLQSDKIVFVSRSTMMVQNRTAGSGATSTDKSSERVDNQPVNGKIYRFTASTPKTDFTTTNNIKLGAMDTTGIRLVRGAELELGFNDSPDPKIWRNCGKTSSILLQPGTMKKSVIMHKYDCKIITMLNRARDQTWQNATLSFVGGSGVSEFIQLGETLRTISTNPVTIQYEKKLEVGAYIVTTKDPAFKADFAVLEFNALP